MNNRPNFSFLGRTDWPNHHHVTSGMKLISLSKQVASTTVTTMQPPLPPRIPQSYRPRCLFLHPSRHFSSTPRVEALPPNSLTKPQRPPTQKFLSPKTLMAQQAAKLDQFPTDVGLLPGRITLFCISRGAIEAGIGRLDS